MKVVVAGATGVIGRRAIPTLSAAGHEVTGLVRPGSDASVVQAMGARAIVADALDRDGLSRAMKLAAPDVVVNMLTAIPADLNPKKLAHEFAATNQLRVEATRNLIDAAPSARLISQGLAYAYQPGDGLADEDTPLWRDGTPTQFAPVLAALVELERQTTCAEGLVLRVGHLYGPGSIYATDGSFVHQVRAGKVPLVGGGNSVFSFTHADDVASAIVAAIDRPDLTGVLNVVDNRPAPMREWLPQLAEILRAPAPKRAPAALARLAVGGWGVAFMSQLRGADNTRARRRLDWRPRYASGVDGFRAELVDTETATS